MLKILLKRQLYELNRSFFYDPKKGKSRSKFASAAFIVLYALLMVCVLGGMFAFCAYQLAIRSVPPGSTGSILHCSA